MNSFFPEKNLPTTVALTVVSDLFLEKIRELPKFLIVER